MLSADKYEYLNGKKKLNLNIQSRAKYRLRLFLYNFFSLAMDFFWS